VIKIPIEERDAAKGAAAAAQGKRVPVGLVF
jgi:hypothetical protein